MTWIPWATFGSRALIRVREGSACVRLGERHYFTQSMRIAIRLTRDRADEIYECVPVHRLSQETNRPLFQVERFGVFGRLARDDDNRHWTLDAFHMLKEAEPAHLVHFDVRNDATAPGKSITPKKLLS